MLKQILFAFALVITLAVFAWTMRNIFRYFSFTKKLSLEQIPERIRITLKVAVGQSKIFRFPLMGLLHA